MQIDLNPFGSLLNVLDLIEKPERVMPSPS